MSENNFDKVKDLKKRSGYCHSGAESDEAKNLQKRGYHAMMFEISHIRSI